MEDHNHYRWAAQILRAGEQMEVREAIQERRAKRMFDTRPVEEEKTMLLVEAMRLAPSCNNNQPWRVVVVDDRESLGDIREGLSRGNSYAKNAPLVFAVCARLEDDCHLSDRRDYFLFGCGLAVGEMMLQATELGLIAHPIAGYDPLMVKRNLNIPDDYVLITLVNIGYPGTDASMLSEKQMEAETKRPERKPIGDIFFRGSWGVPLV
jgi:glutaredoxin-dependent peroxiredoxin